MITDYSKQSELIEVSKFNEPIHVIGCGAVGSWLTFFLLKMGFKNITVYDFDEIEEHNLPNQMFTEKQIGTLKVDAINRIYKMFFNDEDIKRLTFEPMRVSKPIAKRFKGIVFCCVDSMKTRKLLYEACCKEGNIDAWFESRIGLFGSYIYTLTQMNDKCFKEYEKTFYADEEAEVSPCGVAQTALPSAVNCASNMLMQMISYIRNGNDVCNEIMYQIPNMLSITNKW